MVPQTTPARDTRSSPRHRRVVEGGRRRHRASVHRPSYPYTEALTECAPAAPRRSQGGSARARRRRPTIDELIRIGEKVNSTDDGMALTACTAPSKGTLM